MLSEMGLILFDLVVGRAQMMILSLALSGAQYHESRWPCFPDWGYQILFHRLAFPAAKT